MKSQCCYVAGKRFTTAGGGATNFGGNIDMNSIQSTTYGPRANDVQERHTLMVLLT